MTKKPATLPSEYNACVNQNAALRKENSILRARVAKLLGILGQCSEMCDKEIREQNTNYEPARTP